MPESNAGQRLTAGWIAFIVIDVILVISVVIFGVIVFRDDSAPSNPKPVASAPAERTPQTPDGSAPAPSEQSGEESPSAPEATPVATTVASPSGNITCTVGADSARCEIASLAKKPKKDKACGGYIGYVFIVTESGVEQPCVAKADLPKASGKDVTALGYGQELTANGFTCRSEESGMGCVQDVSGHGVTLARSGAQIS